MSPNQDASDIVVADMHPLEARLDMLDVFGKGKNPVSLMTLSTNVNCVQQSRDARDNVVALMEREETLSTLFPVAGMVRKLADQNLIKNAELS